MVCPGFMPFGTSLEGNPQKNCGSRIFWWTFYIWKAEKTTNGSAKIMYLSTFTIALWKNHKNTTIPHTNRAVSVADQLIFSTLKEDIEGIRGLVRAHKPIEKAWKSNDVFLKKTPPMPIPLIFLMKKNGFHFHQKRASKWTTLSEAFSTCNTGTFKPSGRSTSTSALAKNLDSRVDLLGRFHPSWIKVWEEILFLNENSPFLSAEVHGLWESLEIEKTVDLPVLCFLQSEFVTHVCHYHELSKFVLCTWKQGVFVRKQVSISSKTLEWRLPRVNTYARKYMYKYVVQCILVGVIPKATFHKDHRSWYLWKNLSKQHGPPKFHEATRSVVWTPLSPVEHHNHACRILYPAWLSEIQWWKKNPSFEGLKKCLME